MDPLDHTPSSGFLCPRERYQKEKDDKVITIRDEIHHIISNPYLVSNAEDEKSNHHDHHSLPCRYSKEEHLSCWICLKRIKGKSSYYYCNHCMGEIHKECVESPSILHSPDHPRHPLKLVGRLEFGWNNCYSCGENSGILYYYCSTCDFIIHPVCAKNPTPLTLVNPRRHEHTLQYFPRKSAFPCDFCGLEGESDYLYACLLCDVMFHKRCVNLPDVIHLSRHEHPLAITPCEESTCQVCHEKISHGGYDMYSCNFKKGCDYAIHSRCAIRRDVYYKDQLEREFEEAYGNIKMFEEKDDGIIRHLSHPHNNMRLRNMFIILLQKFQLYDETCQACIRPFNINDDVYQCMQCDDFIFHKSCAYIPRVIQFMLHVHPLILKPDHTTTGFKCTHCGRYSCGFRYVCRFPMCQWELDTHCASLGETFFVHNHEHHIFVMRFKSNKFTRCFICLKETRQHLSCLQCDFKLCFHCATLPSYMSYEHDEHFLFFAYKENTKFRAYCCGICEEDIYPVMLYSCEQCRTTFHVECLLGRDPYLKPGTSCKVFKETILALPNTHSTRPICKNCERRCPYKVKIESSSKDIFCSMMCCESYLSSKL